MRARSRLSIPERRVEGDGKVTGAARYAADVDHFDALEVAFVRSPHPYARIVAVDVSHAESMPGVVSVITGAELGDVRFGRRLQDWPVLARDHALMVGDRVAAVAADSAAQAVAAARAIEVEFDELEPILDPVSATADAAPILHPEHERYRYLGATRPHRGHPNVQGEVHRTHGDVEAAFTGGARVFEHTFTVPKSLAGYLEPKACMAWVEEGVLHVLTTNKSPFRLRDQMAAAFGIQPKSVVVHNRAIGGDFGGKGTSVDEFVLAHLALATGRAVRTVSSLADDVSTTTSRHAATLRLRTAVSDEGIFLAHEAEVLVDGGAYAAGKPNPELVPSKIHVTLSGYEVPAARLDVRCVYTNTLPGSNARSPGQPQSAFAGESHVDLIALAMGIDPVQLRLRNAIRNGGTDVTGVTWAASTMPMVLEALQAEMDRHPLDSGYSRGVASGSRPVASGDASVVLTVRSGMVHVVTGVTDQGGGAHTMLQRVVAEELRLDFDRVVVRSGNTAEALWDKGVGGSRVTPVVGGAAQAGAAALRAELERLAPERPAEEQLRLAEGAEVTGEFSHPGGVHSAAACFADVAVDIETGMVDVARIVIVADVGTVINPVSARGQLVGGVANGLGYALMEELTLEDGLVTSANLSEYKMPTIGDMPEVDVVLLEGDEGPGPFGAKSTGELSNYLVAPAVANAVHRASGARILSLPITAEKVYDAIR